MTTPAAGPIPPTVPTLLESIESGITEATGHFDALVVENRTLKAALRACLTYIEQKHQGQWVPWPVRAYRYLVPSGSNGA